MAQFNGADWKNTHFVLEQGDTAEEVFRVAERLFLALNGVIHVMHPRTRQVVSVSRKSLREILR